MKAPEADWENVPPDEWPFVYLIHQPGEYVIDGEVLYRDLYGTWCSTEPIDLKPGDVHEPGDDTQASRVRSVEAPPEPNYQALIRFEWAGEPPSLDKERPACEPVVAWACGNVTRTNARQRRALAC